MREALVLAVLAVVLGVGALFASTPGDARLLLVLGAIMLCLSVGCYGLALSDWKVEHRA